MDKLKALAQKKKQEAEKAKQQVKKKVTEEIFNEILDSNPKNQKKTEGTKKKDDADGWDNDEKFEEQPAITQMKDIKEIKKQQTQQKLKESNQVESKPGNKLDWDNTIVNDDIDKMITDNIKNEEEEQKPEEKTKLGWAERAKARVEVAKVMTTAEEYFPELGKEIDPEFLKAQEEAKKRALLEANKEQNQSGPGPRFVNRNISKAEINNQPLEGAVREPQEEQVKFSSGPLKFTGVKKDQSLKPVTLSLQEQKLLEMEQKQEAERQAQLTRSQNFRADREKPVEVEAKDIEGVEFKQGPVRFQNKKKEDAPEQSQQVNQDLVMQKQDEAIRRAEERMLKERELLKQQQTSSFRSNVTKSEPEPQQEAEDRPKPRFVNAKKDKDLLQTNNTPLNQQIQDNNDFKSVGFKEVIDKNKPKISIEQPKKQEKQQKAKKIDQQETKKNIQKPEQQLELQSVQQPVQQSNKVKANLMKWDDDQ